MPSLGFALVLDCRLCRCERVIVCVRARTAVRVCNRQLEECHGVLAASAPCERRPGAVGGAGVCVCLCMCVLVCVCVCVCERERALAFLPPALQMH